MKNWTWKEWTALGLVVAVLVAEVVSVFVAPWAAVLGAVSAVTAVLAYMAGRIVGKRSTTTTSEEKHETDDVQHK